MTALATIPTSLLPLMIPLAGIVPSPYQHRTFFDEDSLMELADSMEAEGLINAVLVRALPDGRHELMAGHRRVEAARHLEWEAIKAQVLTLDDGKAAELVLIEQFQHAQWQLSEQAHGVAALYAMRGPEGQARYTMSSLAETLGKSRLFVQGLLALAEMPKPFQAAVDAGDVAIRCALVVSVVRDPQQRAEAVKRVLHPEHKTTPLTQAEALVMVREKFARSLVKAPFAKDDPALETLVLVDGVPHHGGACSSCPAMSGNRQDYRELLQGGGTSGGTSGARSDVCTHPPCFALKAERSRAALLAKARAQGMEVIEQDEARKLKLFCPDTGEVLEASGYVALNEKADPTLAHHYDQEKMPTWKALIKEHGTQEVTLYKAVRDDGALVDVCKREEAMRSVAVGLVERKLPDAYEGRNVVLPTPEEQDGPTWDSEAEAAAKHEAAALRRDEARGRAALEREEAQAREPAQSPQQILARIKDVQGTVHAMLEQSAGALEMGLALLAALVGSGLSKEALKILAQAHELPPGIGAPSLIESLVVNDEADLIEHLIVVLLAQSVAAEGEHAPLLVEWEHQLNLIELERLKAGPAALDEGEMVYQSPEA